MQQPRAEGLLMRPSRLACVVPVFFMVFEPRGGADGLDVLPGNDGHTGEYARQQQLPVRVFEKPRYADDYALTGWRGWKTAERLGDGRRWCWRNAALVA